MEKWIGKCPKLTILKLKIIRQALILYCWCVLVPPSPTKLIEEMDQRMPQAHNFVGLGGKFMLFGVLKAWAAE